MQFVWYTDPSLGVFLVAKSTGKSQRAKKPLANPGDDLSVPISAPREGGAFPTELKCPHHSLSSHFLLYISDSLGFFLRRLLEVRLFLFSSSLPLAWEVYHSSQHRSPFAAVCASSMPTHLVASHSGAFSSCSRERARHWSSPTSDTRPLQWGWIDFAPFPNALSKDSWSRGFASWLGSSWECSGWQEAHCASVPCDMGRKKNVCLFTGSCQFCHDEGSVISQNHRGCHLSGLCFEAAGRLASPSGCWYLRVTLPSPERPSGGRAILPGCRKLQATPRLCYKGPLCCELAHHPVKISFHFS